jgi:hypothetical protein
MSATAPANFGTPMEELLAQFEGDSMKEPPVPPKPPRVKPTIKPKAAKESVPALPEAPVKRVRKKKVDLATQVQVASPPPPFEPSMWQIVCILGRKLARLGRSAYRDACLGWMRNKRREALAYRVRRDATMTKDPTQP